MESLSESQNPVPARTNISIGSQQVSVLTTGKGQGLILLHSLLADYSSFDLVVKPLSRTHKVILMELPGFGASDSVGSDLETIADRVAAAIHGLDLDHAPILLGNGYGGFIAMTTAIRHPGIAARLIVTGCGAAFPEPGRAAFKKMSAMAKTGGLSAVADIAMQRLFSTEFQLEHQALIAERKSRFLTLDPQTFCGACEALAEIDLRPALSTLNVPTMVLSGEQDQATPIPMARELAESLPNACLHILSDCAHVPQLQAPDVFLAAISDFITINPQA